MFSKIKTFQRVQIKDWFFFFKKMSLRVHTVGSYYVYDETFVPSPNTRIVPSIYSKFVNTKFICRPIYEYFLYVLYLYVKYILKINYNVDKYYNRWEPPQMTQYFSDYGAVIERSCRKAIMDNFLIKTPNLTKK